MSRTNYLGSLVLLMAALLAISVLMVFWPTLTLPVQAQSENTDNSASDAKPTGKHLIAFKGNKLPNDYAARIAALGGSVDTDLQAIGVVITNGLTEEATQSLRSDKDVQSVDRDMERQWLSPMEEASTDVAAVEDTATEVEPVSIDNPADAFYYKTNPRQWDMQAIKADQAWAKGLLGSPEVTVAILDTGIDNSHTDLQGRVDSSRFRVDRTRSKSFVPSDDALVEKYFPGRPPWTDLHRHGTHVAATVSSNALAAAGVTSKAQLLAVKVLGANGSGADSGILAGIMYAADNGADVINMSLGGEFLKRESHGTSPDTPSSLVSTINRAINYAYSKGTTIVVAAGNDEADMNKDSDLYRMFCESPHVVCVSATGPTSQVSVNGPWKETDSPASYSNYGSPITVAAPGGNGDTFVWAACSRTMLLPVKDDKGKIVNWAYGPCRNGTFVLGLKGTSMATPHVSGLAALLVGEIGKGHPSEVAARIRESAEDLGNSGEDANYGHGRIDVAKALGL